MYLCVQAADITDYRRVSYWAGPPSSAQKCLLPALTCLPLLRPPTHQYQPPSLTRTLFSCGVPFPPSPHTSSEWSEILPTSFHLLFTELVHSDFHTLTPILKLLLLSLETSFLFLTFLFWVPCVPPHTPSSLVCVWSHWCRLSASESQRF